MSLIYKPEGAALEYCPGDTLALNPYQGLCPHACSYCYANRMLKRFGKDCSYGPKPDLLDKLDRELGELERKHFAGRIHLSFMGDIYAVGVEPITRDVLQALKAHGLAWQILTKRPSAAVEDLDLYDGRCWFGTTVTEAYTKEGGDLSRDRVKSLIYAREAGVKTWVSVEPAGHPDMVWEDVLGRPDFIAVGIRRSVPGWNWTEADARQLQNRLQGWRITGWYLKQSIRALLAEGPYKGNLVECGWTLAEDGAEPPAPMPTAERRARDGVQ